MKHTLFTTAIAAATALLSSCGTQNTSTLDDDSNPNLIVIDVDNPPIAQPIDSKSLIDTAYLITFKGDNLLIGDMPRAYKYGDRIFVTDFRGDEPLKIFDGKGNLLRTIHKGGGPGELDFVRYVFFDTDKNTLYVTNAGTWTKFDSDGNFIGKEQVPLVYVGMTKVKGEFVFCSSFPESNPDINCCIFATDEDFHVTHKYLTPTGEAPEFFALPITPIGATDGHAYIMRDTIYWYQNATLTPKYYYKYPDRRDFYNPSRESFVQGVYFENSQTTVHSISYPNKCEKYIFRDKKTGNFFVLTMDLGNDHDNNALPWYCSIWTMTDNGYFVSHITDNNYDELSRELKYFLSPEDQKILADYKPDDNPILVLFKFKEF